MAQVKQNNKDIENLEVLLPEEDPSSSTLDFFEKPRKEQIQDLLSLFNASVSVSSGIFYSLNISFNLHFAGQLGDKNMQAGIGLCIVVLNCLGLFLGLGFNQGFGSLAARAFGSNSQDLLRSYYNKAVFTILIITSYLIFLTIFLESVLITIGQDPVVSSFTQTYFVGILPGIICYFYFDLIRNLCNSIGIFNEPLYMQIVQLALQYVFCKIFISGLDYGFSGIIIATNLSYICQLGMIVLFLRNKQVNIKPDFNFESIKHNYKGYITYCLNLSLPNMVDSFCFELNSILIGTFHNNSQFNAHAIASNVTFLLFSFPLGLGGALCTLISNAIGENNHVKAKNYFKMSYFVGLTFAFSGTLIFQFFGEDIGYLFTNEKDVVDYFMQVLNLLKFFLVFDHIQGSQSGIMKAIGEGRVCFKYFLISFYVVGNSTACTFGFLLDFQMIGFWMGLICGILTIFTLQTRFLVQLDWKQKTKQQQEHLMNDKKALEEFSLQ